MMKTEGKTDLYPWGTSRRFNSYADYFRKRFGGRLQKVSIDAGFTCPNRDGTKGLGGCSFCNNNAFNPSYCNPSKTITRQINEGIAFLERRYRDNMGYLAYFQAYSNTYADAAKLHDYYYEALAHPAICGLVIGTRPDCIDYEKIDLLRKISADHFVSVEYGVESCYDRTLERINRKHTFGDSVMAIKLTAEAGIHTGAHFILGLPGETRGEMMDEAGIISSLPLDSVKLHQLQIIKGTGMEKEYLSDPGLFNLFGFEEYVGFLVEFLSRLRPGIVIERFTGEAPPRMVAVRTWNGIRSDRVSAIVEKRMEELNTWQGKKWMSE